MAKTSWARRSYFLALLLLGSTAVAEQDVALELEFLEFLAEGRQIDGEYHDPLQMQNWSENAVADTTQQQEDKGHE